MDIYDDGESSHLDSEVQGQPGPTQGIARAAVSSLLGWMGVGDAAVAGSSAPKSEAAGEGAWASWGGSNVALSMDGQGHVGLSSRYPRPHQAHSGGYTGDASQSLVLASAGPRGGDLPRPSSSNTSASPNGPPGPLPPPATPRSPVECVLPPSLPRPPPPSSHSAAPLASPAPPPPPPPPMRTPQLDTSVGGQTMPSAMPAQRPLHPSSRPVGSVSRQDRMGAPTAAFSTAPPPPPPYQRNNTTHGTSSTPAANTASMPNWSARTTLPPPPSSTTAPPSSASPAPMLLGLPPPPPTTIPTPTTTTTGAPLGARLQLVATHRSSLGAQPSPSPYAPLRCGLEMRLALDRGTASAAAPPSILRSTSRSRSPLRRGATMGNRRTVTIANEQPLARLNNCTRATSAWPARDSAKCVASLRASLRQPGLSEAMKLLTEVLLALLTKTGGLRGNGLEDTGSLESILVGLLKASFTRTGGQPDMESFAAELSTDGIVSSHWREMAMGILAVAKVQSLDAVTQMLLAMGDGLRVAGAVLQAHACYLMAGLRPGSPEAIERNFQLIGADVDNSPTSFARADVEQALQRTEALELSIHGHPIPDSGRPPSAMTTNLQSWRLSYATHCLNNEKLDVAEDYLDSITQVAGPWVMPMTGAPPTVRTMDNNAPFAATFFSSLDSQVRRARAMRRSSGVPRSLNGPVSVEPVICEPVAPLAARLSPSPPPSNSEKVAPPPTTGVYMHSATNPSVLHKRAMEDFTGEGLRPSARPSALPVPQAPRDMQRAQGHDQRLPATSLALRPTSDSRPLAGLDMSTSQSAEMALAPNVVTVTSDSRTSVDTSTGATAAGQAFASSRERYSPRNVPQDNARSSTTAAAARPGFLHRTMGFVTGFIFGSSNEPAPTNDRNDYTMDHTAYTLNAPLPRPDAMMQVAVNEAPAPRTTPANNTAYQTPGPSPAYGYATEAYASPSGTLPRPFRALPPRAGGIV